MSDVKRNDWALTLLENKNLTLADLKTAGVSGDNTGLLPKKDYEKSPFIVEKFSKEGKFNQEEFDKFYKQAATSYQAFVQDEFEDKVIGDSSFDPFNTLRPNKSSDRDIKFDVAKVENSFRQQTGAEGINRISNPLMSVSELAQMERVFNYDTGKFEDYSPNDYTLFGSENPLNFFKSIKEPLVLAQYEEDGTHINVYGREVSHKKGDLKKNEDGMFYYETLSGRTPYNKQFKSVFDSITVDGSNLNKYDFFDSDGLNKSITGSVVKSAVALAPLFIPGGMVYYGAALVGAELFNILPFVYNSTLGLNDENPTSNKLWGIGNTLKGSTSQHSKDNMITVENTMNLLTDVALQWAQQRAIFSGYHKLFGTEKISSKITQEAAEQAQKRIATKELLSGNFDPENIAKETQSVAKIIANNKLKPLLDARNRTAANASLGYMAILTGQEQFGDAINQGATQEEAAALAWGSILGIFAVTRTGLGEIFLPELGEAREASIKSITDLVKEVGSVYGAVKAGNLPAKKGLAKLFTKAKDNSSKFWSGIKNHSLGFTGKMVGEGIEEVSEEFVMDFAKATFNLASSLGVTMSDAKLNAFEDMGARYGMSFFGGALGGGVFAGVEAVQKFKSQAPTPTFIDLIQNGQKSDLLKELELWEKKGKLGNPLLSSTKTEEGVDGEKVWAQGDAKDNQNSAVANIIKNYINSVDKIINQENLNFSDEEIVDKIIMGNSRLKELLKDDMMNSLGTNSKFIRDWKKVSEKIVDVQQQIEAITNNPNGDKLSEDDKEKLAKLQQEKAEIKLEQEKFLNGTYSEYYVDQMLFKIDDGVNKFFFTPNFKSYAESITKKSFDEISDTQLNDLKESYKTYINSGKYDEELNTAYDIYKKQSKELSINLQNTSLPYQEFLKYRDNIHKTIYDIDGTIKAYQAGQQKNEEQLKAFEKLFKDQGVNFSLATFTSPEFVAKLQKDQEDQFALLQTIDDLVSDVTKFGYVDAETKKIFTDLLEDINFSQTNVLFLLGKLYAETGDEGINAIYNVEKMYPLFSEIHSEGEADSLLAEISELKGKLDSLNFDELAADENTTPIVDSLTLILNDLVLYSGGTISNLEEARRSFNEDSGEFIDLIPDYLNSMESIINTIKQDLASDNITAQKESILKKLETVKNGPLMDFLSQTSKGMFGKDIDLFKIIEDENNRLGAQKSLFDYVMDENRDKEMDEALRVLDMTEAIINASTVNTLTPANPFGHNQIMNDFLKEYFPGEEPYGIIPSNIAGELLKDINLIRQKILFAKELSDMNKVNQFAEHYKTGETINSLLLNVLRGKDGYKFLHGVKYEGIYLLEGINDIESYEDHEKEMLEVSQLIHNNFKKMVALGKDVESEVVRIVVKDIINKLETDTNPIYKQKTSILNSKLERLEDYDVVMSLVSIFSLNPYDFYYNLNEVINEEELPFAPLYSQELAIRYVVANALNPNIFNTALETIRPESGDESHLKIAKNTILINGIGGAGKTSAVGAISLKILKKILGDFNIIKAGPTKEQAVGLSSSLKEGGPEYNLEELLTKILGKDLAINLLTDLENSNKESKLYDFTNYKSKSVDKLEFPEIDLKPSVVMSSVDLPKVIYIDEYTHFNTFIGELIGNWAEKNGITVIALADMTQNGADTSIDLGALVPLEDNMLTVRTPKLQISMRITNIQKKDNIDNLLNILNNMQYDSKVAMDPESPKRFLNTLRNFVQLKYCSNEEVALNGEKVVNEIDLVQIEGILNKEKENTIGFVYDDDNSPTYKKLRQFIDANPQYEKQLKFFTPKEVQGAERDYFIIDRHYDFSKLSEGKLTYPIKDFAIDLYTMITRSKNGTFILDNGLTKFIDKEDFNVENEKTTNTPSRKEAIEKFSADRKEKLANLLEGYSYTELVEKEEEKEEPSTKEDKKGEPKAKEETDEESDEESDEKSDEETDEETDETDEEDSEDEDISDEPDPKKDKFKGYTYIPGERPKKAPTKEQNYVEEALDPDFSGSSEIDLDKPIEGIRAYGWYKRWGVEKVGENKYKRSLLTPTILDDLNIFMGNEEYTKEQLTPADEALRLIRTYIQFGQKFDEDSAKVLEKLGMNQLRNILGESYIDQMNKGEFVLRVRESTKLDTPIDKNGLDETKIEQVAFDIVYRIPVNNPDIQLSSVDITMGKLANPETWISYLNNPKNSKIANKSKLEKTATQYKKWYNDQIDKVLRLKEPLIEFKIDKSSVTYDNVTRIVPVLDNDEKVKYQLVDFEKTHPGVMRSPIYIYSGNLGEFSSIVDGNDKHLKGRAILFVTANPYAKITYKNSSGEEITEKVTPENIERLYQIQKEQELGNVIRMVPLDANGSYLFPKNAEGWSSSDRKDDTFLSKKSIKNDFDEDGNLSEDSKKYLSTFGNIYTDAQIIQNLWNYRTYLMEANEAIENTSGIEEANNWLNENYAGNEITITNSYPITVFGKKVKGKLIQGGAFSPEMIKSSIKLLDIILDQVSMFVTLPSNPKQLISKSKEDFRKIANNLSEEISVGKMTSQKAYYFTKYLGHLFQGMTLKAINSDGFKFVHKLSNGNVINILNTISAIDEIKPSSINSNYAFASQLFNLILHGKVNPYSNSPEYGQRSFAVFKNGIFYHPRFEKHGSSDTRQDFYPAANADSQFYINAAIEAPNINITINPTKLEQIKTNPEKTGEESDVEKSEKLKALKLEYKMQVINFLADYKLEGTDLLNTLEALDNTKEVIVDGIIDNIQIELSSLISNNNITQNGDIITELKVVYSEGKFKISKINSIGRSIIDKVSGQISIDEKTNLISGINEIVKDDIDSKIFFVTLENGNTVTVENKNGIYLIKDKNYYYLNNITKTDDTNFYAIKEDLNSAEIDDEFRSLYSELEALYQKVTNPSSGVTDEEIEIFKDLSNKFSEVYWTNDYLVENYSGLEEVISNISTNLTDRDNLQCKI